MEVRKRKRKEQQEIGRVRSDSQMFTSANAVVLRGLPTVVSVDTNTGLMLKALGLSPAFFVLFGVLTM